MSFLLWFWANFSLLFCHLGSDWNISTTAVWVARILHRYTWYKMMNPNDLHHQWNIKTSTCTTCCTDNEGYQISHWLLISPDFSSGVTMKLTCLINYLKFGTNIHVCLKMSCNHFDGPLNVQYVWFRGRNEILYSVRKLHHHVSTSASPVRCV